MRYESFSCEVISFFDIICRNNQPPFPKYVSCSRLVKKNYNLGNDQQLKKNRI